MRLPVRSGKDLGGDELGYWEELWEEIVMEDVWRYLGVGVFSFVACGCVFRL